MAAPFTHRTDRITRGLVSTLLHKLEIPVSEPEAAENAVRAVLSEAPAVTAVTKETIDRIASEFGCETAEVQELGAKLLQEYLACALRDRRLSPGDHHVLRHLVAIFGVPAAIANRAVKGTGKSVFRQTLAEASADGEISPDEHRTLRTLKRVLNLSDRLPVVGVDWPKKFRAEWDPLHKALFHLHERAAKAKATLEHIAHTRPDLAEHTNLHYDLDEMQCVVVESDELINDIGGVIDRHEESAESHALVDEAKRLIYHYNHAFWRRFQDLLEAHVERAKGPIVDPRHEWRTDAAHRRREDTAICTTHGFDPQGSPKQVAWAIGIIAETVIGSAAWLALVDAAEAGKEGPEADQARGFLGWLRKRNAWWWINVGQNTDLGFLHQEWTHHRVW